MFKNMHIHIPKSYKQQKRKFKATSTIVKAQNAKIWQQRLCTQNKGLGFRALLQSKEGLYCAILLIVLSIPRLIVVVNGKVSIVQKLCAYIHMTRFKWIVSEFLNLFFMKNNIEKTSLILYIVQNPQPLKALLIFATLIVCDK